MKKSWIFWHQGHQPFYQLRPYSIILVAHGTIVTHCGRNATTRCMTVAEIKVQMLTRTVHSFVGFSGSQNLSRYTKRGDTAIDDVVALLIAGTLQATFLRHVRVRRRMTSVSRVCDVQFSSNWIRQEICRSQKWYFMRDIFKILTLITVISLSLSLYLSLAIFSIIYFKSATLKLWKNKILLNWQWDN